MKKEDIESNVVDEQKEDTENIDNASEQLETEEAIDNVEGIETDDKTDAAEEVKELNEEEKKINELEKEVLELQFKVKSSDDKLLRAHAEFENFRKRGIREKNDIRINTQFDTISAILPVLDHFGLALDAAEKAQNVDAVLDGMKLIKTEFEKALDSFGIETINAVGETFDPEIHEAIANEPSDEFEKDVVIKQWRAGYKLGDRLIRPATVVVSMGNELEEENNK